MNSGGRWGDQPIVRKILIYGVLSLSDPEEEGGLKGQRLLSLVVTHYMVLPSVLKVFDIS